MIETATLWVLLLATVYAKVYIAYFTFYSLNTIFKDEGFVAAILSAVVIIPLGFILNLITNFIFFMPLEELWGITELPVWLEVIVFWFPPSLVF